MADWTEYTARTPRVLESDAEEVLDALLNDATGKHFLPRTLSQLEALDDLNPLTGLASLNANQLGVYQSTMENRTKLWTVIKKRAYAGLQDKDLWAELDKVEQDVQRHNALWDAFLEADDAAQRIKSSTRRLCLRPGSEMEAETAETVITFARKIRALERLLDQGQTAPWADLGLLKKWVDDDEHVSDEWWRLVDELSGDVKIFEDCASKEFWAEVDRSRGDNWTPRRCRLTNRLRNTESAITDVVETMAKLRQLPEYLRKWSSVATERVADVHGCFQSGEYGQVESLTLGGMGLDTSFINPLLEVEMHVFANLYPLTA